MGVAPASEILEVLGGGRRLQQVGGAGTGVGQRGAGC